MYQDAIDAVTIDATSMIMIPFNISFKLNGRSITFISKDVSVHSKNIIKFEIATNDANAHAAGFDSGIFFINANILTTVAAIRVTGTVYDDSITYGYKNSNTNLFIQIMNIARDIIVLNTLGDASSDLL